MAKKRFLAGMCIAIALVFSQFTFTGFAADSDDTIKVRRIEMAMETATVRVNQERTLFAEVFPYNADDKIIEWSSSNPEVVMVEGDGTIVGVSPGTAEITAISHNGKTAVCTVSVPAAVLTETEQQVQNSDHPLAEVNAGEVLGAAALRLDVENAVTAKENKKTNPITLTYTGKTQVSTAALRSAAFTASYNSKEVVLCFRTLDNNGQIQGLLSISPRDAGLDDTDIRLAVYTAEEKTGQMVSRAEKYFGTSAVVVYLEQEGEFPITAQVAAKLDFTGFDTGALKIYHYANGTYTLLDNQEYHFDSNGYIHFSVSEGGIYAFTEQ